ALNAFAVGNAADGKRFIQAASFAADHDPGENLDPLLISFDDASMDADAVADLEIRTVAFQLLFFDRVDDAVHDLLCWVVRERDFATVRGNCNPADIWLVKS